MIRTQEIVALHSLSLCAEIARKASSHIVRWELGRALATSHDHEASGALGASCNRDPGHSVTLSACTNLLAIRRADRLARLRAGAGR